MSVKVTKVKNMKIDPGKGKAYAYETAPDMPKAHQNCLVIGPRGSGKTVAVVNLVERMPYHRIFIISPSVASNRSVMDRLRIDPSDVYEDPDDISCLDKIKAAVEQERDDYEQFLVDSAKWKAFTNQLKKRDVSHQMFEDDILDFWDGHDFVKPVWKYGMKDGQPIKPCMALILDDCVGSGLYTRGIRKLNAFTIFHRHIGQFHGPEGGALGISLFFLVQSFRCAGGGLSKCIRNNTTSQILFKTKSSKELDEVSEECSGEVSKEDFMKLYEYAVREKHDFLFIDMSPKPEQPSGFRRNLDEYLTVDSIKPPE